MIEFSSVNPVIITRLYISKSLIHRFAVRLSDAERTDKVIGNR